jgi:hypothetical protein
MVADHQGGGNQAGVKDSENSLGSLAAGPEQAQHILIGPMISDALSKGQADAVQPA